MADWDWDEKLLSVVRGFDTNLSDALRAIRLNHNEFTGWYAQHRVIFQ